MLESADEDRAAEVKDNISIAEGEISILTLDSKDTPYLLIEDKSRSAQLEPLGFITVPLAGARRLGCGDGSARYR